VRNSLHQFTDFRFQILVRDDQRLERGPNIAAAGGNGLVRRCLKPVGVGLWIGRAALRLCIPKTLNPGIVLMKSAQDGA
jgi:hypothetical protein